jgi:tripartite-type tricarboxylate transporter receptor subunit TctC
MAMVAIRALILIVAGLLAIGGPVHAQNWPTRPLTMVVPFPPGGGTDVLGRIIGRKLSEILGQQVVIENVGGAGGMIGSARMPPRTATSSCWAAGPMPSIRHCTSTRCTILKPTSTR